MEYEADMYGINAGQQPDGEAEVDLMLGGVSEARSGADRGVYLFRSSQRQDANHGGDAVEGGTFAGSAPGAVSLGVRKCAWDRGFLAPALFRPFRAG